MENTQYGLSPDKKTAEPPAPDLDYLPRPPRGEAPPIGLIGAGGITEMHLSNYQKMGWRVTGIADADLGRAEGRRDLFYPEARVCTDYRELLRDESIRVVDIATHVDIRPGIVREALEAGKHVLSQKPFCLDLEEGKELVELARVRGLRLAVNQNGRWAPHFSYMREAVKAGLIGEIGAISCKVFWDHSWIKGTPFEKMRHVVLYDFAIHWFDIVVTFMGGRLPVSVYASTARARGQEIDADLLAHVVADYGDAQITLAFNAGVRHGEEDATHIAGSRGSLLSAGPSLSRQEVTLHTDAGTSRPDLQGTWFENGFQGTMAELLFAIEEDREPSNSGESALAGLAFCFAAIESANTGQPVKPGSIRKLALTRG